jgi:hypothetical protein
LKKPIEDPTPSQELEQFLGTEYTSLRVTQEEILKPIGTAETDECKAALKRLAQVWAVNCQPFSVYFIEQAQGWAR